MWTYHFDCTHGISSMTVFVDIHPDVVIFLFSCSAVVLFVQKKSLSCHLRALIQYLSISTHGYDLWILWKMCWFNHLHIWYCLRSRISMKWCLQVLSIEKGAENVFWWFFFENAGWIEFYSTFFCLQKICLHPIFCH